MIRKQVASQTWMLQLYLISSQLVYGSWMIFTFSQLAGVQDISQKLTHKAIHSSPPAFRRKHFKNLTTVSHKNCEICTCDLVTDFRADLQLANWCTRYQPETSTQGHIQSSPVFRRKNFENLSTINHKNFETCTTDFLSNVDCKFFCSLLVSTAWHSFLRFGTTLSQREGELLVIFEQVKYFLRLFYENIAGLNCFCHCLSQN